MKINSRRIQAQPALTSCTEMEEGWRGVGSTWHSLSHVSCQVWGVGWGREAGCELSPFQFPGERQWVVNHQGSRQICLKRFPSHLLHPFHPPDTSLKIFSYGPILPSFPLKLTVQGLSNQEHLWVPEMLLIYHVQQMLMSSSKMYDGSNNSQETSGIKA